MIEPNVVDWSFFNLIPFNRTRLGFWILDVNLIPEVIIIKDKTETILHLLMWHFIANFVLGLKYHLLLPISFWVENANIVCCLASPLLLHSKPRLITSILPIFAYWVLILIKSCRYEPLSHLLGKEYFLHAYGPIYVLSADVVQSLVALRNDRQVFFPPKLGQ